MSIERMLDKHVFGDDKETMWVRKDKNLLLRIHRQTQHLRSGNNPYPEDRPRSCGECPQTICLLGDHPYIFYVVSLCVDPSVSPPLIGVYHRKGTLKKLSR